MLLSLLAGYVLLAPARPADAFQTAPPTQAAPAAPKSPEDKAAEQHQKEVQADIELGKRYAAETDKEYKPSTDKLAIDRIQRIGKELAKIANETHIVALWGDKDFSRFDYSFKVIKGDDVNAFSIPGGYIYVFEGLVKNAESDDEIAGVLAHEIAHASLRHVATLQREQQRLQNLSLPAILAAIITGSGEALTATQAFIQAKGSGWSVKAEQAADYGGFQYMLKSKYDPTGMMTFMERLASKDRLNETVDWGIYRTHPPSRERAQSLQGYIGQAGLLVRRSKVTTTYRASVVPGEKDTVDLVFGKRRLVSFAGSEALARADDAADLVNEFFDQEPGLFELKLNPGGQIFGRGKLLLTLTAEDAEHSEVTLDQYQQDVLKNLKFALLNVGFRIWDRL